MAGIDEQSKMKNEGEIRYLSPLDISTSKEKNIVCLEDQVLNMLIIKILTF